MELIWNSIAKGIGIKAIATNSVSIVLSLGDLFEKNFGIEFDELH